ncbi:TRPM3 [Mytilus coruscus]|uniref:TRPM3 n=1 Tax=Mytilus coruscus TaxID=42192 RepID=A0A6J8BZQ0_MYTCO|nr:TRPM3 [Mytilus coruscus]
MEPGEDQKPLDSGIGNILPRSFLEGKPEAREVLEKKKRRDYEETRTNRIKRIPNPSFIFEKKPNFTEVFYIKIPDTELGKELLLHDLPIQWTMPEPEAVISITGIDHQFNIKDNCNLKRDLIEAVISTESWIVTCGTESGVVRFIEDAVNAHVAMKNCHIPIVGILPQRVYKEMQTVEESRKDFAIRRRKEPQWVEIPCKTTNDVLDPIHTQFIFTNNAKSNPTESTVTCRDAFEHFLSNINTKETDDEPETRELLPVVLVLIEGGIDALRTARSVLENENHVVVIEGSGGAADILAACYNRASRESNCEIPDKNITEIIEEHFDDDSKILIKEIKQLTKCCMQEDKREKIHVFSLDKNTNGVDEIIQDAMFEINKEYHKKKIKNEKGMEKKNDLKTNAVKEHLKLVEKWQRSDIAKKEIFLAKKPNATYLKLNKKRMTKLQFEIGKQIKKVKKWYIELLTRDFPEYYKTFEEYTNQFIGHRQELEEANEEIKTQYLSVLSTSFMELVEHLPVDYLKDTYTELKDITHELDTGKKKSMTELYELEMQIRKVMVEVQKKYKSIHKDLSDSHRQFKNHVLQFKDVNNNKATYFSKLSESFKKMIDHMTVHALKKYTHKLRKIVKDIVDEYKKDMVSQLFLSSIITNRKDLVELTMDRIENIEAFVFDKIANIYWRCIKESPEDLPIKLITQNLEKRNEKTEDTKQKKKVNYEYEIEIEIETPEDIRNRRKSNKILFCIDEFIRDLFGDTKFELYKDKSERSALFASAVLKELADRAHFSNLMDLTASLNENASFFEDQACAVITELYNIDREKALKTLVTKVNRYNSTPLEIAYSQKLTKFMAHTACQAKLNSIWYGDIALYTPSWRIAIAVFLPILIIQNFRFIPIPKKDPCQPRLQAQKPKSNNTITSCQWIFYYLYMFYRAPATKFFIYMIVQTNRGSPAHNLQYWAKNVWNIFDIIMYLLFLVSVFLRCLLNSDQFYFARMAYAITLSMFILRSMHFFFVDRYIGPKVVMIGRMLSDLAFFISLFALFVFSFGIMYQAVLFPNSVLSPWELLKDLVYFPYWQLYGELNLDHIEGTEPSECTHDYELYINGTMERCAQSNQFNSTMLAVYLILTNILLVNILIAMFSYTFQKVQDNSEMIWKFNMYALIYEYYDRPMFPIPILIHLFRIIVFCYYKLGYLYESDFELLVTIEEMDNLNIVEHFALQNCQNGPSRAGSRYNARNMMTDERDMNTETDSTPIQKDIQDLRESMTEEIRRMALRQPIVLVDLPRR